MNKQKEDIKDLYQLSIISTIEQCLKRMQLIRFFIEKRKRK